MKLRQYPKALEFYIPSSTPEGYSRSFAFSRTVWSETEYNSYFERYKGKYFITERPPKWKELKGKNFFSRVYYTFPVWVTYSVGIVIGYVLGHLDTVIKYGKELYQILFQR
jgi:hypothetical protein